MMGFSKNTRGFGFLLLLLFFCNLQKEKATDNSNQSDRNKRFSGVKGVSVDSESPRSYKYNIGTGIAQVTDPATGLGMQGMADDKQKTTGVETYIYSRAFIIEHDKSKKRVVLLNADIWSCTHALKKEVVRRLQTVYGDIYTMNNVLISGTHTHSGPGGYSHYYLYNHSIRGFDNHNFNCIVSGMMLSIQRAHKNLAPGRIYINKGEIDDCGRNRSLAAYNNNPLQERNKYNSNTDKEMLLLKFVKIKDTGELAVGAYNWYGIHPTDRGQKNTKVTGDNKGYASYLFENQMQTKYTGQETFVAAFANGSAGDVSGNVEFGKIPDGSKTDLEHMRLHGRKQYEKAKELFNDATEELKGDLDYRHSFIDMVVRTGAPGALGLSMFAGSREDSDPGSGLREGITINNITASEQVTRASIGSAFSIASGGVNCPTETNLTQAQIKAHSPKPITLAPGITNPIGMSNFVPLSPTILPVQLFKIGQLVITGVPAELTTMSGRRLKEAIQIEMDSVGVKHVALNTYANDYSQYVTTKEEYNMQHYEGGSTLFGPNTLNTYIAEFKVLAKAIKNNAGVDRGPLPPDLTSKLKRINRITIRNQSSKTQTLDFYNVDDKFMGIAAFTKVIPARGEMAVDLTRPNNDVVARVNSAKVVLNKNKSLAPAIYNRYLITITSNGLLRVAGSYTPPPR